MASRRKSESQVEMEALIEQKRQEMAIIARREKSRAFFTEMPAEQRIAEMKRMADYIKANGTSSDRSLTIGKSLAFPSLMGTSDPAAKLFFEETLAIYNRLMAEAQTIRMSGDASGVSGVWFALGTVTVLAAATAWRNR